MRRDPDRVRGPDVALIPADRIGQGPPPRGFGDIVPALIVEVISPNDLDENVQERVAEFLAFGVDRIWLVRPATRTVEVIRAGGDAHIYGEDDTLTSDDAAFAVEGFELPVASIFA